MSLYKFRLDLFARAHPIISGGTRRTNTRKKTSRAATTKPRVKKGASQRQKKTKGTIDQSIGKYRILATCIVAVLFIGAIYSLAQLEMPTNIPEHTVNTPTPSEQPKLSHEPEFSFYAMLKDFQIEVAPNYSENDNSGNQKSANKSNLSYFIQAGSFKTAAQAEQRLVELTLLGLNPSVGTVTNSDGKKWHRVLLGPFTSRSQMSSARSVIINNDIEAMVMRRTQ